MAAFSRGANQERVRSHGTLLTREMPFTVVRVTALLFTVSVIPVDLHAENNAFSKVPGMSQ